MAQSIFRAAALERLSSPERLDELICVTNPRAWLALAAGGVVLAAALLWSIGARVPLGVGGQGFLVRAGGMRTVVAQVAAEVTEVRVGPTGPVTAGDVLVVLTPAGAAARTVTAPVDGRIIELLVAPGDAVHEGTPLVVLESSREPLAAILYVNAAEAPKVRAGLPVLLTPAGVAAEESGYLMGRVRTVSAFPVSQRGMARALGSSTSWERLAAAGAPHEVVVELERVGAGFRWSARGSERTVEAGVTCAGRIVTATRRPISFLVQGL
jgi:multidrug resistance efflux pump